jgi:hypothetical protein
VLDAVVWARKFVVALDEGRDELGDQADLEVLLGP